MPEPQLIADATDAAIAEWIALRLRAALALTEAEAAIALPGGSTPFPILAELVKRDLPWGRIATFPTDDRLVAEDHPASNTGKLRAVLAPAGVTVTALSTIARADGMADTPQTPG